MNQPKLVLAEIKFYSANDPYGFFSNFSRHPIWIDSVKYATTEHYFQCQKFVGTKYEEQVRLASSPGQSANLGRRRDFPLRKDWEKVKDDIMYKALLAKFTQHEDLRKELLDTGNATLIEHTYKDSYWADGGDGSGKNMLGKLLMKLRDELRGTQSAPMHVESNQNTSTQENNNNNNSTTQATQPAQQNVLNVGKLKPQKFDYFCVLDFEATCEKNKKMDPQEIVEFPTVVINAKTLEVHNQFQVYVKPRVFPKLTDFCKELTGIQQDWVDNGVDIEEALIRYDAWLKEALNGASFAFVTCGDWDLNSCLPRECQYFKMAYPEYFKQWINIKLAAASFYKRKAGDLVDMLSFLGIKLEGRHHSGIDDCKNISKILIRMLRDGHVFDLTRTNESNNNNTNKPEVKSNNNNTAPKALGKLRAQDYDYFCVLDFEAACEDNKRLHPQEIIEFPTVIVDAKTLEVKSTFQQYVKPRVYPKLTKFCTDLTGIQQDWVDAGADIEDVLRDYDKWLQSQIGGSKFIFVTCGDWDLNSCLPRECEYFNIRYKYYFNEWINLKKAFGGFYKRRVNGMTDMLSFLGLKLIGRHHSGIDDCKNIAQVLIAMLKEGYEARRT